MLFIGRVQFIYTQCFHTTSLIQQGVLYNLYTTNKGKGKGHPTTGHEGPEGE